MGRTIYATISFTGEVVMALIGVVILVIPVVALAELAKWLLGLW